MNKDFYILACKSQSTKENVEDDINMVLFALSAVFGTKKSSGGSSTVRVAVSTQIHNSSFLAAAKFGVRSPLHQLTPDQVYDFFLQPDRNLNYASNSNEAGLRIAALTYTFPVPGLTTPTNVGHWTSPADKWVKHRVINTRRDFFERQYKLLQYEVLQYDGVSSFMPISGFCLGADIQSGKQTFSTNPSVGPVRSVRFDSGAAPGLACFQGQ